MMTRTQRDKGPSSTTKQEPGLDDGKSSAAAVPKGRQASSRSWPGLKDPRIVRVSRAFGGKDRHSKVSTVRGLRDRRVRLSVQTAIQLYDLQDRLGLNQPSKVVDWLLDAAQHEIDKLPPLQVPPGSFATYPTAIDQASHGVGLSHQLPSATTTASNMEHVKDNGGGSLALLPGSNWAGDRDYVEHHAPLLRDHGLFRRIEQHEQHHGVEVIVPVQDNLQRLSFFSMPSGGGGGGGGNPFASYCILETSMGGYPVSQVEEAPHGYRPAAAAAAAAEQPSLSLSHGSPLLFLPSGAAAAAPMFSPYGAAPVDHYGPKHVHSVLQMGSSASASPGVKHHHF